MTNYDNKKHENRKFPLCLRALCVEKTQSHKPRKATLQLLSKSIEVGFLLSVFFDRQVHQDRKE